MKFYILLFLSSLLFFEIKPEAQFNRVINNSSTPVNVKYELPIYNRADTTIHPIKSQEELQELLYEAILTNSTHAIDHVVKAGADVNTFYQGKAPLMWATQLKKLNSVETLKRHGAIIPCPKKMLYRAILNDSADDVKHAITAGADPNDVNVAGGGLYPLGLAVFLTKSKAVQALIESGANPNSHQNFKREGIRAELPLKYALSMGDIKTALILLKHNKNNLSNLDYDILKYIFEHVDPLGIENTILEFIQELINQGYNINSAQYNASNQQYKSAWVSVINSPFCSVKFLELLMKNGANPNQRIHDGACFWTPLHIAIQANRADVVKFLLETGVDLTIKAGPSVRTRSCTTNPPQTALSYAQALAFNGVENQKIINLLLQYRAPR